MVNRYLIRSATRNSVVFLCVYLRMNKNILISIVSMACMISTTLINWLSDANAHVKLNMIVLIFDSGMMLIAILGVLIARDNLRKHK